MGCTGSKQDVEEVDPEIEKERLSRQQVEKLRKEIGETYDKFKECKTTLQPLIAEKVGIQVMIDEEREKLLNLMNEKEAVKAKRDKLMDSTWAQDADDIYRAFGKFSMDKNLLITILINRTNWQIQQIAGVFESKYGTPLLSYIVNEMQTVLGKLATGGVTGLSKLLAYRVMPQQTRDAAFLRDFSNGALSLDDESFIEIVTTRTNDELRRASEGYYNDYHLQITDIVTKKSSGSYRDFLLKVLECRKDEDNRPYPDDLAEEYAEELYQAGGARMLGHDPEPFIRILAPINNIKFESINAKYKNNQLLKDIQSKLSGDFREVVVARCSDKYEYLAQRLDKALKGYSANKESICRILGCLSRPECLKLRLAYDRTHSNGRPLDASFKAVLQKGHYQKACLDLISGDTSVTPTSSDNEPEDDERECDRESEGHKEYIMANYRMDQVIRKGEKIIALRSRGTLSKFMFSNGNDDYHSNSRSDSNNDVVHSTDINLMIDDIEDQISDYTWNPVRGRLLGANDLQNEHKICTEAYEKSALLVEQLGDEINGLKDAYFQIVKLSYGTEVWKRIYKNHIEALKEFIEKREFISPKSTKPK